MNQSKPQVPVIKIEKPIWKLGCVGINRDKLKIYRDDWIFVEIMYVRKSDGKRQWPDVMTIEANEALSYPTQRLSSRVTVHLVPIDELRAIV